VKDLAQDIINGWPEFLGAKQADRPMLGVDAAALLMECVAETRGDYIEIGSGTGGSAVMAALAMEYAESSGNIYCIDPFSANNKLDGVNPRLMTFWLNMYYYEIQQRAFAFPQYHPPFPEPIYFHIFDVGLIDGEHNGNGPRDDFRELNTRVNKYLLFDNAEMSSVDYAINDALSKGWEEYKVVEYASQKEGKVNKFVALRRKEPLVDQSRESLLQYVAMIKRNVNEKGLIVR